MALLIGTSLARVAGSVSRATGAPANPVAHAMEPDYGVVFVSSGEEALDEQRHENALSTGATWDRWPMYWSTIETRPGTYHWTTQDATVEGDLAHGLLEIGYLPATVR